MEITTIALLRTWYASPIKMSVLLCSVGVHIICNKVCMEFKKILHCSLCTALLQGILTLFGEIRCHVNCLIYEPNFNILSNYINLPCKRTVQQLIFKKVYGSSEAQVYMQLQKHCCDVIRLFRQSKNFTCDRLILLCFLISDHYQWLQY